MVIQMLAFFNRTIIYRKFFFSITNVLLRRDFSFNRVLVYFNRIITESQWIVLFCISAGTVVTVLESFFHMDLVLNDTSMVPGFSSLVIVRELGPVVTGLLIASITGTGWAAETAVMTSTEQIDAMRLSGIDPYGIIVVPRIIASLTAVMVQSVTATVFAMFVTMIISIYKINISFLAYLDSVRMLLIPTDIFVVMIKGFTFGLIISLSSCFHGLHGINKTSDAGYASTKALVSSTIYIIFMDLIINWIFSAIY